MSSFKSDDVLLAAAKIRITDSNGQEHPFRALIDPGSETSFVTQKAVSQLNLPRIPVDFAISGVGNCDAGHIKAAALLQIRGRHESMPAFNVDALIIRQVTSERHYRHDLSFLLLPHLSDLKRSELADDDLKGNQPIDVLLGVEVLSSILRSGVRVGGESEPVAQRTSLG